VVCLGKSQLSILDPVDKVPQDENKTKSSHSNCSFLCDSCQISWIIQWPTWSLSP